LNITLQGPHGGRFFRLAAGAVVAALSIACASAPGAAQNWPSRTITVVSPFSAGSGVDLLARHIGNALSEKFGQTVVIDDRSGANGDIGAAVAAKAPADGYTMLIVTPGIAVQNKYVYKTMPFDFPHDFVPIVLIAKAPMLVLVNNDLPIKTMNDLIAYAKANPGKVNVSSSGVGSQGHVTLEALKQRTGVEMAHVPYNSAPQQNSDLLGGQTGVAINYVTTTLGFVQAGKARALAITSTKRMAELPDVPTLEEAGFPGFESVGWYGIFVPRGTPQEVIDKVNPVVNDFIKTAAGQKALKDLGMQAAGGTPADLQGWIDSEEKRWGPILKTIVHPN
jgi:tripartite-type tricarboxylate transporter receptor subunit TctC